jgi:hypothetical protein
MQPNLITLQAALHHLNSTYPLPHNAPDRDKVTSQLAEIIRIYQAISQPIESLGHLISLECSNVKDPALTIEMVTLYQEGDCGIWQSGADTGTYVYVSRSVPEDAVDALAIAATTQYYRREGLDDFVSVAVYNVSEYCPEEE